MDIKIERDYTEGNNDFENYANQKLEKYFDNYPFIQSIQVYLRGSKHPTKKVKLNARLKGKEIFAEARGTFHHDALDNALSKLQAQLSKYKSKRYKAA